MFLSQDYSPKCWSREYGKIFIIRYRNFIHFQLIKKTSCLNRCTFITSPHSILHTSRSASCTDVAMRKHQVISRKVLGPSVLLLNTQGHYPGTWMWSFTYRDMFYAPSNKLVMNMNGYRTIPSRNSIQFSYNCSHILCLIVWQSCRSWHH
jgi:hypothetical protein